MLKKRKARQSQDLNQPFQKMPTRTWKTTGIKRRKNKNYNLI